MSPPKSKSEHSAPSWAFFSVIPAEEIDIPFADRQAKQPDIKRFSASTLVFLYSPYNPHIVYILLCQRALQCVCVCVIHLR